MPHLIIQYSGNLDDALIIDNLCEALHRVMLDSGVFPLAGIRVRAFRCDHAEVADRLAENSFVDMVIRMGEGRPAADRKRVGESIMSTAQEICQNLLQTPHFALSLEIVEISREFSWKTNTMHARLNPESDAKSNAKDNLKNQAC